jgi:hypothetical protein
MKKNQIIFQACIAFIKEEKKRREDDLCMSVKLELGGLNL